MASSRKPGKTRITVQIGTKIVSAVHEKLASMHIKRDAYLNDLLKGEIEELAKEIQFRNTDEVRRALAGRIAESTKVTLELDEDVSRRIDEVLRERNIARDAFLTRVYLFLFAPVAVLDVLGVGFEANPPVASESLNAAAELLNDPFFPIRTANSNQLYSLVIGNSDKHLRTLNCAVSEEKWHEINVPDDLIALF